MIWLKEINITDKESFTYFERRYKKACGDEIIPVSLNNQNLSFEGFWQSICDMQDERTCPKGFVPAKYFLIMDEQNIVGTINLRYKDNETILTRAGHIGYGVAPWERGKGYATEGLRLCLIKAWRMGMDKVLLTTDLNNFASQRVIEKNGGVYDRTLADKKLYWIDLSVDSKLEESAMAVVFCNGAVLTTVENIYGNDVLSLPKGHVENNETLVDTAIRECIEETGVSICKSELIGQLSPFEIRFIDHHGIKICKTITPLVFVIPYEREPKCSEVRIINISYLPIEEFVNNCSYDNVRVVMKEACKLLQY